MVDLNLDSFLSGLVEDDEFADVVNGDTLYKDVKEVKDNGIRSYESITYRDLLPKEGYHLGLDLSKNSTGITVIRNGEFESHNFTLKEVPKEERFRELIYRRQLYNYLKESYEGCRFKTIVVEDVHAGVDPQVTRMLYSLNTVIDELVYDGYIDCDNFIRANNKSWKSWLWSIEPQVGRGLDDKGRIEALLKYLGVSDQGKGYQDRLDSLGMLIGYFFKNEVQKEDLNLLTKVRWSDVYYGVVDDLEDIKNLPSPYNQLPVVEVNSGTKELTKDYIKYLVASNKDSIVAIKSARSLTLACMLLGIEPRDRGTLVVMKKVSYA